MTKKSTKVWCVFVHGSRGTFLLGVYSNVEAAEDKEGECPNYYVMESELYDTEK